MKTLLCALVVGFLAVATASAQPAPAAAEFRAAHPPRMDSRLPVGPRQADWMGQNFFLPELVMRHQQDIALTPDQQAKIRSEQVKFAGHVTDLRWEQSASEQTLAALLKQENPDEKAILAEQEKLLKVEGDIKLSRLTMLIRIKNTLTPEQKVKLTHLKERMEHHLWRAHEMWGHGMGFRPGFGNAPPFAPGMPRPVPRRFPIHGEGMGYGGQPSANTPPAPPVGPAQP